MNRRHSQKRIKTAFFTAIAVASLGALAGCELLVDFDRTLIDGGSLDNGDATFDGAEPFDSSTTDAPSTIDASDSGSDAVSPVDAGDSGSQDASDDADADAA